MPQFLVVTPTFNCVEYIEETLESVRTQTDGDWIHYLMDGGSTDGTLQLLHRAAERDQRRRVVSGPDVSMYDALFKGFERAAADEMVDANTVCVWLNGDDLLMPWAFARLRQAFDESGARWITAIPSHWDASGRLAFVSPYHCWYPRWLIRAGQFNGRSLGWIQQESTFFTYGLLSTVSPEAVATIRSQKNSGEFLLWREFAKHSSPTPLMTVVAGFRQHTTNSSSVNMERYYAEIKASGVWIPPEWLAKQFRRVWEPLARRASYRAHQREVSRFWNHLRSGPSGKAIE